MSRQEDTHKIALVSPMVIIRIGLGIVFLANALTAIFKPEEFIELLDASVVSGLLPFSAIAFTKLIAINDTIVAILLLTGRGGRRLYVWSALWIAGALAIIGKPLDILEETGLLAMASALLYSAQLEYKSRKRGK